MAPLKDSLVELDLRFTANSYPAPPLNDSGLLNITSVNLTEAINNITYDINKTIGVATSSGNTTASQEDEDLAQL
jgi:hypothetical protein